MATQAAFCPNAAPRPHWDALRTEPRNREPETWLLESLGNPAVMGVNPKTGGFASPSFDGFALYLYKERE